MLVTEGTALTMVSRGSTASAAARKEASRCSSGARNSSSSAVVVPGRCAQSGGTPSTLTEARSVLPSISSTARAPASLKSGTAVAAAGSEGKKNSPVRTSRSSGRVSKTISERKPRVPSEPTTSPRRIYTGVAPSRKESSR